MFTPSPFLLQKKEVAIYLFNDTLMTASHVRVSDFLGKTKETLKRARQGDSLMFVGWWWL